MKNEQVQIKNGVAYLARYSKKGNLKSWAIMLARDLASEKEIKENNYSKSASFVCSKN